MAVEVFDYERDSVCSRRPRGTTHPLVRERHGRDEGDPSVIRVRDHDPERVVGSIVDVEREPVEHEPAGHRIERPDIVHVATEGPLGWSALKAGRQLNLPCCADFHTNFHSYSAHYGLGLMKRPIARYLKGFHNQADCTMVPTEDMLTELYARISLRSAGESDARSQSQ